MTILLMDAFPEPNPEQLNLWGGPTILELALVPEGEGYPGSWCRVKCAPDCHDTGCHDEVEDAAR